MKEITPYIGFIIAFLLTFKIIPVVIRIARLKNLVDEPNHRTSHKQAIPTLGGVGIFIGFSIIALLFASYYYIPEFNYLILGMLILFFIGIKDDIMVLSAKKKLVGQIGVALLISVLGDLRITSLQGVLGFYEIPYLVSIALTAFIYISLINAINLIDGIDGLASGVCILVLSFFGANFYLLGHYGWMMLCLSMVGSLSAFFLYNVYGKSNKIFMGDTGSLILGLFVTATMIKYIEMNTSFVSNYTVTFAPAVALSALILPIFDTLRVFSVRIAQGKSPFSPDKNHIHHILLSLGLKHRKATGILVATNALFIGLTFLLKNLNVNFMIAIISLVAISLIGVIVHLRRQKESRKASPLSSPTLLFTDSQSQGSPRKKENATILETMQMTNK